MTNPSFDSTPDSAPDAALPAELVTEALSFVPLDQKHDAAFLLELVAAGAADASEIVVRDDLTFARAGEVLVAVKNVAKRLEGVRTSMKGPVLEAGRAIDAFFRTPTVQLEDAEKHLKRQIATYQAEAERKRREHEEAARLEREQQAELHTATVAAQTEEEAMFGDSWPAEATSAAAAAAPEAPRVPQVKGVSSRVVIKARVTDRAQLLAAAAAGHENAGAILAIDEKALNALAKAFGARLSIPGVETYEDTVVSARG